MIRALLAALLLAFPASADGAGDDRAARAAEMLERAEALLASASGPAERRAALGRAAQAREAALATIRDALRAGADRRADLEAGLSAEERRVAATLDALLRAARAPRLVANIHPEGAVAAARAASILSETFPAVEAEAARLREKLDELGRIDAEARRLAASARGDLAALASARAALDEAGTEGAEADPALRARLAAEAERLAATAASLRALAAALGPAGAEAPSGPFGAARGLAPPAEGRLLRRFGAEAGARRLEGVEIATPPWAAVYAPWRSVVRFAGPFGKEGVVVILEPDRETLIVLSGLASTRLAAGETALAGEPVGAMGGPPPAAEEFLLSAGRPVEALPAETLYMEVRRGGAPADPTTWFDFGPEEDETK